jgi:hypothetical protein
MPRYYFDLREDGELAVDEEGVELPTLQAVQIEAAPLAGRYGKARGLDKSRNNR